MCRLYSTAKKEGERDREREKEKKRKRVKTLEDGELTFVIRVSCTHCTMLRMLMGTSS